MAPVMLLPENEEWLHALFVIEDPLLVALAEASNRAAAGDEDAPRLPEGLDGEAVYAAWGRIVRALPEPLWKKDVSLGGHQLFAPDGRWEHTPLYAVEIDPADVEQLASLFDHLRTAAHRAGEDLFVLLEEAAEERAEPGRRPVVQQVVADVARAVSALQLDATDDDTRTLLQALAAAAPGERIVLTEAQEEAYRRLADRFTLAIADPGDQALTRFTF
ncbi:hypothetical protein [Kitasatospora sp. HPMI-4]|uniref:hypothetical protein n=1 Tax=Kitasatospora sp. HPMI-4 TaxID=3448443 RepID=UPI003F1AB067